MPFDVKRLLELGRVSSFAVSPDGEWLAVAVQRQAADKPKLISSLWRVDLRTKEASPLTRGANNDRAPCFRRDGSLGFISDRKRSSRADDDKHDQVWLLPAVGGEPVPLTDEPLGAHAFRFAKSGDRLIVITEVLPGVPHEEQRKRGRDLEEMGPSVLHYEAVPVRHWDHWLGVAAPHVIAYDERGGGRRDLTPAADREHRGDFEWDVSRDGSRVAVVERRLGKDRSPDTAIRVIETASGESRLLGATPNLNLDHPRLSPSGKVVACTHNVRSPAAHGKISLATIDTASGELRIHGKAWDRWPSPQDFASETRLVVVAEENAKTPVFAIDLRSDEVAPLTASRGTHGSIVVHGDAFFGVCHSLVQPPEVFRGSLEKADAREVVTDLSGFSKEEAESVLVNEMHTTSTDGAHVHSYLIKPKGTAKPVVMWIHGGPVGAFGDLWHWRWNPLVMTGAGYAVALPNARGSTGYGQAFVEGIWNNQWGAQCYRDLMAVTDALEKRSDVDGSRMASMGGSFGGYMTNWIGGQTTRFKALVTHASIFHMEAFSSGTDYGPWFQIEMGATPRTDPEALNRYSPHRFVKAWKTPTLILHGEKDYRVPVHEALVLFDALQELGVHSELVVFPDENHWILKPRNIEAWYAHVLRFLRVHLEG